FSVIRSGTHIINIAAMTMPRAGLVGLFLVFVIHAVETTVNVILVLSPGDAGHDMDAVSRVAPRANTFGQAGIDAIGDGDVRAEIAIGAESLAGLKASAFQFRRGIDGKIGDAAGCAQDRGKREKKKPAEETTLHE